MTRLIDRRDFSAETGIASVFGLPPEKAIEYFQSKGFAFSWDWRDVWQESHAKAFTVAKAMRMDVLTTIRGELDNALKNGMMPRDFQKALEPKLKTLGWWGKHEITDADGVVSSVQLGSPHRLKTIYRQNMQTSMMAGRYKEFIENVGHRPYWQYIAILDGKTRPAHRALHLKVFRYDDPIWNSHFPPNGWSCFPPGTLVATPKGWIDITQLHVGDSVFGGSGDVQPITAVHVNPFNGDMIRLSAEGIQASMTPNHRILTLNGWIRADHIKVGDVLVQISQATTLDLPVGYIDEPHTIFSDNPVSFPIQGKGSVTTTLDSDAYLRNNDIHPVASHQLIKLNDISSETEIVNDALFAHTWQSAGIRMGHGVKRIVSLLCGGHFFSNVWSSRRRCTPQAFCHGTNRIGRFLGLSQTAMTSFGDLLLNPFFCSRGLFCPAINGIDPLSFDSCTPFSWGYAKEFQDTHERSDVDTVALAKSSIRHEINDVPSEEGFTRGAPLDQFDSLEGFRRWARLHARLLTVSSIDNVPYNGNVYNLSIAQDESYCIPIAVAHNCRCRVRALSERDLQAYGLSVSSSDGLLSVEEIGVPGNPSTTAQVTVYTDPKTGARFAPDAGWSYNPGKAAWFPDLDRYDYNIAQQYIKGGMTGPDFKAFYDGVIGGNFPVAVLSPTDMQALGAARQTVLLSSETLADHIEKHPDVGLEDYQKLPDIIENGEVYQQGDVKLIYLWHDGKLYRTAIKTTEDRLENYVVTLFVTTEKTADRQLRNKLERLR